MGPTAVRTVREWGPLEHPGCAAAQRRASPFLLGQCDAALEGGGKGRAEQGPASIQSEILARVEHDPRGGIDSALAQRADVSDG